MICTTLLVILRTLLLEDESRRATTQIGVSTTSNDEVRERGSFWRVESTLSRPKNESHEEDESLLVARAGR